MSDAITYQHDDEGRRGTLKVWPQRLALLANTSLAMGPDKHETRFTSLVSIELTDDEAISLYRLLASHWAGYVAEMDESAAAVRRGVPLAQYVGDWREQREQELRDLGPDESFGAYVDSGAADLARDTERGK